MANAMNQNDLSSKSDQQMEELQGLLPSSQPSDLSCDHLQQQQVEDEVTIEMKEMIQYCGHGNFPPECCIYRVPNILHQLKEKAFTPKVVSIGPFHYGDKRLEDMESHKQIVFKRFTQRARTHLDELVRCVKDLEPKVRASYSETINLTEQKFVKLILMDAAFIIEFFIMFIIGRIEASDDVKLSQPCLMASIITDLSLLENQLPFFVIEELFNKAFPYDNRGALPSFLTLACKFVDRMLITQNLDLDPEGKINHFTDLVRLSYLQGKKIEESSSSEAQLHTLRYNANELKEAGIKLKPNESKPLLDFEFFGDVLRIPQIWVADETELFFRNMIALEQCHYPTTSYITDYAAIMNYLIDTDKDVVILVHKRIVMNTLGDYNDVASLFNGLGANAIQLTPNSKHIDICKRLNAYCENDCQKKMATLRRDYCDTPWRTVASIAGIILLLLTFVQTILSILQVVLKK